MNIARILIFSAIAGGVVASVAAQSVEGLANKPVPSFTMTDLNGKKHTNKSLRGKVVLLDFWATWCGPCKAAGPTMQKLSDKYKGKGLVVVGANIEPNDTPAIVKAYRNEHNYTYTFTTGNGGVAGSWGIEGIPAFLIIDKKGIVRKVETGFNPGTTETEFDALIAKLLKS